MRNDPMGAAVLDYHLQRKADKLRVLSSMFEEDEIPVPYLFRTFKEMPPLEQKALTMAKGRVLDVGAGAGSHALWMQENGLTVTCVDISQKCCCVMQERGLNNVRCLDILKDPINEQFDTITMMMNGIGLAGDTASLPSLLTKLKNLLTPNGQILTDSCDLKYIFEDEDGSMLIDLNSHYYGQVDFTMKYKDIEGESFNWLYIDFDLLQAIAASVGLKCSLIANGDNNNYLARLHF